MTHRVYLRWPGQRVSDKTVTEDREVAETAFRRLVVQHAGEGCAAIWTAGGVNQQYVQLDADQHQCRKCWYRGPFIDEGETCPQCLLVQ